MYQKETVAPKTLFLMMLIAYAFSFAIRMIWVYQFQDTPDFQWNGQLMINTNDGYFFASGAQKALEGTLQYNPRVPGLFFTAAIALSAFIANYFPVSLDTVVLYLPAVVSSLVVVPVILIGRLIGSVQVGFFAALIGSIAWSYYNRTMIGYYDTDMFSAMAPMFILYFLMATIKTEKTLFALLSALAFLIYPFLYDGGRAVVYAMGLLYMGYMLLFHRRDDFTYHSILLIAIGLMHIQWTAQLILIAALYVAIHRKLISARHSKYLAVIAVLAFLYSGHVFSLIWHKVMVYFERGVETEGLKFFQVSQTVREAGIIPFDVMANRISGSVPGVLAALAGYLVLTLRHKEFILALPLIGIGLFSLFGGLRFTVFAVPVAAISAAYLFYYLAGFFKEKKLQYTVMLGLTALMLYPNIIHIINYKVPTVFTKQEVAVLDDFKKRSSSRDYVITWWDYGYPIWYYADKNTLIDGGKHNHDNFLVSEILRTPSQTESARLSRIAVETYISSDYKIVSDTIFKNNMPDQLDVAEYLDTLKYGDVQLPEKTTDIYLYLPLRMLDIFPTVTLFSNLDLNSGTRYKHGIFYSTQRFQDTPDAINLDKGVTLLKREGALRIGSETVPINTFYTIAYGADGHLDIQRQNIAFNGKVSVIYLASYRRFLVLDNSYLNSTFIQMFIFENYDKELFEPVISNPLAKIYKLKI